MRLVSADLHGYRRFAEPTKIDLYGRLIAIVGPNEAGKSSILQALDEIDTGQPIPPEDLTRRGEVAANRVVVRLRWLVEPADRAAIAHLHSGSDLKRAYWLVVAKRADGSRTLAVEPRLVRDLDPRHQLAGRLDDARKAEGWLADVDTQDTPGDPKRLSRLIEALGSQAQSLPPDVVMEVRQLAALLHERSDDEGLARSLDDLADHESQSHPNIQAGNILFGRVSRFLAFDEQERALDSQYDLDVTAAEPPAALENLAKLAGLDLVDLHDTITRNDTGDVVRILTKANARLAEEFTAWTQYPIEVRFDNDGNILRIHVSTLGGGYTALSERSDGLKQFVALIALTAANPGSMPPILLIDEAESHLHYDAQADLVQVFARQDAAAQIIYTTHSAGCLPEDLGAGIRIVEPMPASNHSRVLNRFWSTEPGLSPLLLGMGAATLAFVPVRNAVIAEGPSELVLLPTLLREATGRDALGYQIAPGASNVKPASVAGLDLQAPRTAWLVDGDKSGAQLRRKLTKAGIPKERIVMLGEGHESGLVLEDLVDPDVYLWAVNEELRLRSNGIADELTAGELPKTNRPAAVDAWCNTKGYEPPGKINVANHIIEQRVGESIAESDRVAVLISLDKMLTEAISRDNA